MFTRIHSLFQDFWRCRSGVTLVEYGVALAVAALFGAVAVAPVITNFNEAMSAAGSAMAGD